MKTFDRINPVTRINAPYLFGSLHINGLHARISYREYLESISSLTLYKNASWELKKKLKVWRKSKLKQREQL